MTPFPAIPWDCCGDSTLLTKGMHNVPSLVAAALAPRFLQATVGPLKHFFSGLFFFLGALLRLFLCSLVPVSLSLPRLCVAELLKGSLEKQELAGGGRRWQELAASPVPCVCVFVAHVLLFG